MRRKSNGPKRLGNSARGSRNTSPTVRNPRPSSRLCVVASSRSIAIERFESHVSPSRDGDDRRSLATEGSRGCPRQSDGVGESGAGEILALGEEADRGASEFRFSAEERAATRHVDQQRLRCVVFFDSRNGPEAFAKSCEFAQLGKIGGRITRGKQRIAIEQRFGFRERHAERDATFRGKRIMRDHARQVVKRRMDHDRTNLIRRCGDADPLRGPVRQVQAQDAHRQ